jgi:hypothetical protein
VFAPTLDQLYNIQGPLFIHGGEGAERTGLLERRMAEDAPASSATRL